MKKLLVLLGFFLSVDAYAWKYSANVKIVSVIAWESLDDGGPLHFKLSNDVWCYVPSGKKTLHSLIMAIHVSGKEVAEIHCYDNPDSNSGGTVQAAHKLHRIVTK